MSIEEKYDTIEELLISIQKFVVDNFDAVVILDDLPKKLLIGFKCASKDKEITKYIKLSKLREYDKPELFSTLEKREQIAKRLMAGEKLA